MDDWAFDENGLCTSCHGVGYEKDYCAGVEEPLKGKTCNKCFGYCDKESYMKVFSIKKSA